MFCITAFPVLPASSVLAMVSVYEPSATMFPVSSLPSQLKDLTFPSQLNDRTEALFLSVITAVHSFSLLVFADTSILSLLPSPFGLNRVYGTFKLTSGYTVSKPKGFTVTVASLPFLDNV